MLEHQHIIVWAEVNNPPTCPLAIKQWLGSVVEGIGMKLAVGPAANPISYYCDLQGNKGLTGVAILETSHCAIHVWDDVKPGVMQFDLYSCSKIDPQQIFKFLEPFGIVKSQYKFLDRSNGLTDLLA